MRTRPALAAAVAVAALWSAALAAATPGPASPAERPRIGLVLSGGAAHGLAHVGVLKVLEELRVPVDVVAGTSMGAIVGGLYASGVSPAEMELILGAVDWEDLFDDRPPRARLSYRRKQDDARNYVNLEMGLTRRGVAFPSGLVAGQKLNFLLKSLTLGSVAAADFDALPIPFRCVSTDIGSGEKVVHHDGSLAEAIRASMSLPAIFSPVEKGGRLLVDGGLVDNLPVAEAEAMGAELIVAVDVSSETVDPEKLKSFGGILNRTISLPIRRNVAESLPRASVVLHPAVVDVPPMDFSRTRDLIARGEKAARASAARLAQLGVSEDEYRAYRERLRALLPPPVVDSIQTVSAGVDSRQVTAKLETRAGRPIDVETLRRDLDRIYEMGVFETVDFRLVRDDAKNVLVIDARPKSWGPTFLRIGAGFEANFDGDATLSLLATVHRMQLNSLGAEWRSTLELGSAPGLRTELYQPLDYRGRLFAHGELAYQRFLVRVDVPGGPAGEGRVELTQGALSAGVNLGSFGEARVSLFRGSGKAVVLISREPVPDVHFDMAGAFGRLSIDTLDTLNFPRRGTLAVGQITTYFPVFGSPERVTLLKATGSRAFPLFERSAAVVTAGWEDVLGGTPPYYFLFTRADFNRFAALARENTAGERAAYASVTAYQRIGNLPTRLGRGVYIGGWFELGRVWEHREDSSLTNLRPAGGVFGGADTVLGPIYAGVGLGYGGTTSFYVFLGRPF